ncbi:MAG: metallophosphoesterase family protein [Caldisericaceae bacterium]
MSRIIHTGDLHLGFPTYRTEINYDYFKPFSSVVDYAIENRVDLVVIAGDVFDKRDPQTNIQRGFARELHRLTRNNIPVFIITGNHEGAPNPERNIHLDVYKELEIEGVTIAKKISNYKIANLNIVSLPYPFKRNLMHLDDYRDKNEYEIAAEMNSKMIEQLDTAYNLRDKSLPTIFVAHIPVNEGHIGDEMYGSFDIDLPISIEDIDRSEVSYVALGHFHDRQIMSSKRYVHPFVYCGSLDRISFGEENSVKGFFDVTIDETTHKANFVFVENTSARAFYTIRIGKDNDFESIDIERAKKSITRIILTNEISDEDSLRKLIDEVGKIAYVFAGFEDRRVTLNNPRKGTFPIAISPKEAIEKYLELRNDDYVMDHKDQIIKKAESILDEVESGDREI